MDDLIEMFQIWLLPVMVLWGLMFLFGYIEELMGWEFGTIFGLLVYSVLGAIGFGYWRISREWKRDNNARG